MQAVGIARHTINFQGADRLVEDTNALFVEDALDGVDAAFVFTRDVATHRLGDAIAALAGGKAAHGAEALADEVFPGAFGGDFVDAGKEFRVHEAADVFRHHFVQVGDQAVDPLDGFFFVAGKPQRQAVIGEADDFRARRQKAFGIFHHGGDEDFRCLVTVALPEFTVVFDPGIDPVAEHGFCFAAFLRLLDGSGEDTGTGKTSGRIDTGADAAAAGIGAAQIHLQAGFAVNDDAGNADVHVHFAAFNSLQFKAFARHHFFFRRLFQEQFQPFFAFVRHEAHQGQLIQSSAVFDAEGAQEGRVSVNKETILHIGDRIGQIVIDTFVTVSDGFGVLFDRLQDTVETGGTHDLLHVLDGA